MLVVPAHAKVNLALEVTGRRPDGWHEIATVIAAIDWHDLVGVRLAPRDDSDEPVRLHLSGLYAEGVPAGSTNLAHRAALLLRQLAGEPQHLTLEIWVDKQVPAAAGLGGGSADAAAVLRAGAVLLAAGPSGSPSPTELARRAAELGSDVPAVLAGGTVLATGRGEVLTPIAAPRLHLALAVAGPSATAAAYDALLDAECAGDGRATRLADAIQQGKLIAPSLLGSALEAPACRASPGLAAALARLRAATPAHPWHLTGSGGAAFAIAADAAEAVHLAAAACRAGFPARACRTLPGRLGPLPAPSGAR
jgi:4-diphosphocytidyl-2-C-methyl-D-erythritol kinase